MGSAIAGVEPRDIRLSRNEPMLILSRLSKAGNVNKIAMTHEEAVAVANALIDAIEHDPR